ncbi:MAG TPA: manganese efflux pump MntP family protein [Fibrobacteraceae bacterium]|nr:manganese efflux pump MntP family protein [Fibrobacteraceae bacterium]
MSCIQMLLLAFALAMDAMAVSIGTSCSKPGQPGRLNWIMAASFGIFQAGMPWIGYALGLAGASFLGAVDHWIAFALLAFVGGKMLWEGVHHDSCAVESPSNKGRFSASELLMLSVATSIDAAAVGLSLSLVDIPILVPSLCIGGVTFVLSWLGGHFGRILGCRMGRYAEIAGGFVLMAIGIRILLNHLEIC